MLPKLKILIFNNYFFIFFIILTTLFFYLSFFNFYFYFVFFLFLFFFNFYYLRGIEIFFSSFISPLPFYFFPFIFEIKNIKIESVLILSSLLWLIYHFLLVKFKDYSNFYLYFFMTFTVYGLFNYLNFFVTIILYIILIFILFYFFVKDNLANSLIKTIFTSELFWLGYFLPISFYWTTCLLTLLFYFLVNRRNIISDNL